MSYRPEWWKDCAGLLPLCEELHGHVTGSGSALSDERADEIKRHLIHADSNWTDPTTPYDYAVRQVVKSAIREYIVSIQPKPPRFDLEKCEKDGWWCMSHLGGAWVFVKLRAVPNNSYHGNESCVVEFDGGSHEFDILSELKNVPDGVEPDWTPYD